MRLRNPSEFHRAVLLGVDGSGKSTTSKEVASRLSYEHPNKNVFIADSDGTSLYREGKLVEQKYSNLDQLEPTEKDARLKRLIKLGAFTLLRRHSESSETYKANSLLIGVRDPFRIDPAIYAGVFGPDKLKNVNPERRLAFFNNFTTAPHPDSIAMLSTSVHSSRQNIQDRDVISYHESAENTEYASRELPRMLAAYTRIFNVPWRQIEALQPNTTDEVAEQFDSLLQKPKSIIS